MKTKVLMGITIGKDNLANFKRYCSDHGMKLSTKIDSLVEEFLEKNDSQKEG